MEELAQDFISTSLIKTALAPLERYKLVRQTQDILTLSPKEKSNNFLAFLNRSFSQEGARGLFRSNMTAIYMWFPQVFAQRVFYQNIKQSTYDQDILSKGLSGTLCGIATMCFAYPFDTIRVRQATEIFAPKRVYTTFEETRFQVKLESGFFKGLYSGFSVACLHTLLFAYSVAGLNSLIGDQPYGTQLSYLGGFALLYPIDSIRRRLQVKSILFQQEAAKQQNLLEKIKFNIKEWKFSWGYGGFIAHNVRGVAMLFIIERLDFGALFQQATDLIH